MLFCIEDIRFMGMGSNPKPQALRTVGAVGYALAIAERETERLQDSEAAWQNASTSTES